MVCKREYASGKKAGCGSENHLKELEKSTVDGVGSQAGCNSIRVRSVLGQTRFRDLKNLRQRSRIETRSDDEGCCFPIPHL